MGLDYESAEENEPTNQSERTTNFLSLWMGGYGKVLTGAGSFSALIVNLFRLFRFQ